MTEASQPLPPAPAALSLNAQGMSKRFAITTSAWRWWLLAAAIAAFYLAGLSSQWNLGSDSALYLLLGTSLAEGEGYTLFGEPHAFVPPGYPMLLALLIKTGGPSMLWLNLTMIVMGLGAVAASYFLLRSFTTVKQATLCTLLVALSAVMFRHAMSQLSDVPFMLLVVAGLWCCHRGLKGGGYWLELGVLALCACCWFRVVGVPLALAAALGLAIEPRQITRRRAWINACALALGVVVTLGIFQLRQQAAAGPLPQETYALEITRFELLDRSPLGWIAQPMVNLYESGNDLCSVFIGQDMPQAAAVVLLWLPILVGMGVLVRRRQYLGVLATLGYVGAILVLRPLLARYLLPVAPLLFLYYAEGLRRIVEAVPRFRAAAPRVVTACLLLMAAINLPRDVRVISRVHDADYPERRAVLTEAAIALRINAEASDRFVGGSENQLAYLSGGVPFVNLYGLYRYHRPEPKHLMDVLKDQDIRLVVLSPDASKKPYEEVLHEAVPRNPDFRMVFQNSEFSIYRRRATDRIAELQQVTSMP